MKQIIRRRLDAGQRRIRRRLRQVEGGRAPRGEGPEFDAGNIDYEIAERVQAISCGGIGAIHKLAIHIGLVEALDTRLPILKLRLPYSEAEWSAASTTTVPPYPRRQPT